MNPTDVNDAGLGQALRTAAADPPPTRIDLDRLIGVEQRRQRSMRTLAVVCGAAASVLMIAVVVFGPSSRTLLTHQVTAATTATVPASSAQPCPSLAATGNPRPYQSGNPSPRPVPETCGDAAFRLNGALARALGTHAPGVTFADSTGSGQPVRFLRANDENLRYDTGLSLTTSAGRGSAGVGVEPLTYAPRSEADLRRNYACDREPSIDNICVYRSYPDGTVVSGVLFSSKSAGPTGPAGARQYQLQVFRPDHTVVTLLVNNTYYEGTPDPNATPKLGGNEPPLTQEQIIAIGRDRGLTLYP